MSLLRAVVDSVGSTGLMLAGEHMHGFGGAMVGKGIAEGAGHWLAGLRASNTAKVNDLLVGAYRDPQLAAALVQHATADKMPALAERAGRRLAQSAAATAGMQGGSNRDRAEAAPYAGTNALNRLAVTVAVAPVAPERNALADVGR